MGGLGDRANAGFTGFEVEMLGHLRGGPGC